MFKRKIERKASYELYEIERKYERIKAEASMGIYLG